MHEQDKTAPAAGKRRERVEKWPGIYYRLRPDGTRVPKVWEYDYYDPGTGKRKWAVVKGNLAWAVKEREDVRSKARRGEFVPRAEGKQRLADVIDAWAAAQTHLRPRTAAVYETNLRLHVKPRLGARRVDSISADDIAKLIADLRARGLKPWTIRGVLTPLGRVLGFAVRRGWIAENPMRRLERGERPAIERREMRVLGTDEITRLLAAVSVKYRPVMSMAVFTGLRQGELLGLTWADLDLERGLVRVRFQLDRSGNRVAPKTPQAVREVILMPALGRLVKAHREAAFGLGRAKPSDLVFTTEAGTPMYWRNVSFRGLETAAVSAGLMPSKVERKKARETGAEIGETLRFHDLRHTFASILIAGGHDVVFVARQLGHASPKITLDVYGHLFDRQAHAERARDGLEASFGNVLAFERPA